MRSAFPLGYLIRTFKLTHYPMGRWSSRLAPLLIELARGALTWIHLGASIGSVLEPQPRIWNSDDEMESLVVDAFTQEGDAIPPASPRGAVPGGESKDIHQRNGRYISLAGRHALFHLEGTTGPKR